eukprot:TRINITY_DN15731_c0_g1_i1.p1 TRINITY_DN15731_c0_g1~~TRINITY_DN15731_c0_g1_i1.p1  ORF type:complete len:172 (+),score=31.19 TRINITY_DN15731_c0_g1_i1:2-517(+)
MQQVTTDPVPMKSLDRDVQHALKDVIASQESITFSIKLLYVFSLVVLLLVIEIGVTQKTAGIADLMKPLQIVMDQPTMLLKKSDPEVSQEIEVPLDVQQLISQVQLGKKEKPIFAETQLPVENLAEEPNIKEVTKEAVAENVTEIVTENVTDTVAVSENFTSSDSPSQVCL